MPKITFKNTFFRIFWKILAKTGPQSLYLCGFPEASVEMEVAPFRALTQNKIYLIKYIHSRRNGGRPFQGIDTNHNARIAYFSSIVEMEVAPFRALTQCCNCNNQRDVDSGRNEGRPTQGIVAGDEQTRELSF